MLEPADARSSIETSLRAATRLVVPNWQSSAQAPDAAELEKRRREEAAKRDGVVSTQDELSFTHFFGLVNLLRAHWESYKPVFDGKQRTEALVKFADDVRNTIAHNREVVSYERELLSGTARLLANQVSIFQSGQSSARYCPTIHRVVDSFGRQAVSDSYGREDPPRVDVGTTVTFEGHAVSARSRGLEWYFYSFDSYAQGDGQKVGVGEQFSFEYTFTAEDVSEDCTIQFALVADSAFHRHEETLMRAYDDTAYLPFTVNRPEFEDD